MSFYLDNCKKSLQKKVKTGPVSVTSDLHLLLVLEMQRNKQMSHRRNVKQYKKGRVKESHSFLWTCKQSKSFLARSFPEASCSVKTGLRVDKRTNCEGRIRCPHMCGQRLCSFGKLHFTLWMYNLISYFSISETNL